MTDFVKGDIVTLRGAEDENEGRWFITGEMRNFAILGDAYPARCLADGTRGALCPNEIDRTECTPRDIMQLQAMHIRQVGGFLVDASSELARRAVRHDASKWTSNEWDDLVKVAPEYNKTVYGTEEYNSCREKLKPGIAHHEKANSHHLGHYPNGIAGMDLFDVIEMICDCKAAASRGVNSDIREYFQRAGKQHGWSEDLTQVILNTIDRYYGKYN